MNENTLSGYAGFAPVLKIILILSLLAGFFLAYSCSRKASEEFQGEVSAFERVHSFVGDQSCRSCHEQAWDDWKGSHHDYAIAEAGSDVIRGDFNNAEFVDGEEAYRFYRLGEDFMVDFIGADAQTESHRIVYTFGWEPLQQYLVYIGQGKYQALHAAWDTEEEKWFSLYPYETFEPDDWMHWRRGAMNWNTMCADCHSTNLKQNYDPDTDSFHTTWSVLNVSCEACHGPGKDHVELMNSPNADNLPMERIRRDLDLVRFTPQMAELNTCAPCHSFRQKLTEEYIHGDPYMDHFDLRVAHPPNYFADGQILEEVYVYGSFLQSRKFMEGVQCTDCHNPHSVQLREPLTNNRLCLMCHEPSYDMPEHHFHEPNTSGTACVDCHMDGRVYMGNDFRRDHSFRVPRPHQSVEFGTPNACNSCHTDETPEWAAAAIEQWYGEPSGDHYTDVLLKADAEQRSDVTGLRDLTADEMQPEMIRAIAVWYTGRFPNSDTAEILELAMQSESGLIRNSAIRALENLPDEVRHRLSQKALDDVFRANRIAASRYLAGFSPHEIEQGLRDHFTHALQEYVTYLDVNAYFPQAQMSRGQMYDQQGDLQGALEAYRNAVGRDPYFTPARINLAYVLNRLGLNEEAEFNLKTVTEQDPDFGDAFYSLGLLMAEMNRMPEAIGWFRDAAELMPDHGRLFYNLAIAHQTVGEREQAEKAYTTAIGLEPGNGDFRYGLITLYMQQEQYNKALEQAEHLNRIFPNNRQVEQLLLTIRQRL